MPAAPVVGDSRGSASLPNADLLRLVLATEAAAAGRGGAPSSSASPVRTMLLAKPVQPCIAAAAYHSARHFEYGVVNKAHASPPAVVTPAACIRFADSVSTVPCAEMFSISCGSGTVKSGAFWPLFFRVLPAISVFLSRIGAATGFLTRAQCTMLAAHAPRPSVCFAAYKAAQLVWTVSSAQSPAVDLFRARIHSTDL